MHKEFLIGNWGDDNGQQQLRNPFTVVHIYESLLRGRNSVLSIKAIKGGAIHVKLNPVILSFVVEMMNDNVTQSIKDFKKRLALNIVLKVRIGRLLNLTSSHTAFGGYQYAAKYYESNFL
ncbi:hypothetical protein RF11_07149 [Thelohanellus kitauei]|uniref:Uncharacterized protein n=1 Tax=Thelohanellus kitauei TaxID=669202 RepID=A0A0C2NDY3_THEKT|nr:hypothetical protein RF11_07149 [Thelohanellus kitauei]